MDFQDFSGLPGHPEPRRKPVTSSRWWESTGVDLAHATHGNVEYIQTHQQHRAKESIVCAKLYGDQALLHFLGASVSKSALTRPVFKQKVTFNVVASCIDTIQAHVCKSKPIPFLQPSKGKWKVRRKAQKLNTFINGWFYENKLHELGEVCELDSETFGTGVIHVFADPISGRVKSERVLESELHTDELESIMGDPRSMYRVRLVDRGVLKGKYPKLFADTQTATTDTTYEAGTAQTLGEMVRVVEAWHLPSSPELHDGRHVLATTEQVLVSEEWTHDFFPFAFLRWSDRLFGFWGRGIAEILTNLQLEINQLMFVISRATWMAGTRKVMIENSSKVVDSHFDNAVDGTLIRYSGTMPQILVPSIVAPEVYTQLDGYKCDAYELLGVSQLSAAAKKPEGLDSGKALREFSDIESDRLTIIGHRYERLFLDVARIAIAIISDTVGKGAYKITAPGARFVKSIDWKDVRLEQEEYSLQMFPVSSLPSTPAGRLQTVQDLIAGGFVTRRQGRRLLDMPDLELSEALAQAADDYVAYVLDKLLDEQVFIAPEPMDDLVALREAAIAEYNQARTEDTPPEVLELLRRLMLAIDETQQLGQQQAAAQQAATQNTQAQNLPGQMQPTAPAPAGAPAPQMQKAA